MPFTFSVFPFTTHLSISRLYAYHLSGQNAVAWRTRKDLQRRLAQQTDYKRVLIRRAGIFLEQQERGQHPVRRDTTKRARLAVSDPEGDEDM